MESDRNRNRNDTLDHGEDIAIGPDEEVGFNDPDAWPLLEEAIRYREQVVATYNGRRRAFCPHALGYKGNKSHVLVYQFADERDLRQSRTSGGSSEGWRCMDVDRLTDVTLRSGPWHSAPNIYNPQSCMDDIRVVVQVFPTVSASAQRAVDETTPS
jgi:hypothetical protein